MLEGPITWLFVCLSALINVNHKQARGQRNWTSAYLNTEDVITVLIQICFSIALCSMTYFASAMNYNYFTWIDVIRVEFRIIQLKRKKKMWANTHKLYVSFRPKINKRFYVFSSSINAYNLWWYSSQENNMPKNYSFKHKHDYFFSTVQKLDAFLCFDLQLFDYFSLHLTWKSISWSPNGIYRFNY